MALFGTLTAEEMPRAFLDSYRAWDVYMGDVWLKMLRFAAISADATLVEVAPGSSLKLAHALNSLGFQGRLFLVDPAPSAIADDYRIVLPHATITHVRKKLYESMDNLPEQVDAIISNHPFDDMVLAHAAAQQDLPQLFGWTQHDEEKMLPFMKKCWQKLEADEARLQHAVDTSVDDWVYALQCLKPQHCIISHYASSALHSGGMQSLNENAKIIAAQLHMRFSQQAMAGVQTALNACKNYNNAHIGGEILNAANWLTLRLR